MIYELIKSKKRYLFCINIFLVFIIALSSITPIIAQPVSTIALTSMSKFSNISILDEIFFPNNVGNVREIHKSSKNIGKKIIIIQDAHCNYEAQKNIYEIIKNISENNNVKLIAHEGALGNIDIKRFHSSLNKDERKKITDLFLNEGTLTASEAFAIDSSGFNEINIFGVEDKELYLNNFKSFHDVVIERKETINFFNSVNNILEVLKTKFFNYDLKKFYELKNNSQNTNYQLKQDVQNILKYLKDPNLISLKNSVFNKESYPNVKRFLQIMKEEELMDYEKVIKEEDLFYIKAKEYFSDNNYSKSMSHFFNYKTKAISSYHYFKGLLNFEEESKPFLSSCNNFFQYAKIQTKYKEIYIEKLIYELDLLKESIKLSLTENEIQKNIINIENNFNLLKKIIDLKATLYNYTYYNDNKSQFEVVKLIDVLKKLCSLNNISFPFYLNGENSEIIKAINSACKFYECALNRDKALTYNLLNKIKNSNEDAAILIAGGFHTAGITKILETESFDYAVISPNITNEFSSDRYFHYMDIQRKNVKDLILTIPSHLAPVLLLDIEIFDESTKFQELNKLKTLLKIDESLSLLDVKINNLKLSQSELEALLVEMKRLRDEIQTVENFKAKKFVNENIEYLEKMLIDAGLIIANKQGYVVNNAIFSNDGASKSFSNDKSNEKIDKSLGDNANDKIDSEEKNTDFQAPSGTFKDELITPFMNNQDDVLVDSNTEDNALNNNHDEKALSVEQTLYEIPGKKQDNENMLISKEPLLVDSEKPLDTLSFKELNRLKSLLQVDESYDLSNFSFNAFEISNDVLNLILDEMSRLKILVQKSENSSIKAFIEKNLIYLENALINSGLILIDENGKIINKLDIAENESVPINSLMDEFIDLSLGDSPINIWNDIIKPTSVHVEESDYSAKWDENGIENAFNKFFSGESSSYTTIAKRELFLIDMMKFLKIPPPLKGENIGGYKIGEKIIKNLEIIQDSIARKNVQIINYDPDDDRRKILTDFYLNFRRIKPESVILNSLRIVLAKVRREKMIDLVRAFDFKGYALNERFKVLIKNLIILIIEKEKDSLRDLRWKYRANYIDNLTQFERDFQIIENKEAGAFGISRPKKQIHYNPELLNILSKFHKIDLNLQFADERIVHTNLLATFLIGTLEHEIRGHLKHNTSNEPLAFHEQGARYAALNFASTILLASLLTWQNSFYTLDPDIEILKKIAFATIKGYVERKSISPSLISNHEYIIELTNTLIDFYMQHIKEDKVKSYKIVTQVMNFPNRYDFYWERDPGKIAFKKTWWKFSFSSGDDNSINRETNNKYLFDKWKEILQNKDLKNKIIGNNSVFINDFDELLFFLVSLEQLNEKVKKYLKEDFKNFNKLISELNPSLLMLILSSLSTEGENIINLFPNDFQSLQIIILPVHKSIVKELALHKLHLLLNENIINELGQSYEIPYEEFSTLINEKFRNNFIAHMIEADNSIKLSELFLSLHLEDSKRSQFLISIWNILSETGINEKSLLFQELFSYFYRIFPKSSNNENNFFKILLNNKMSDFQTDEIFNFFMNNVNRLSDEEIPKMVLDAFNLIILNIFTISEITNGKITGNEKNMIIEGMVEALAKEYRLENNIKENIISLIKKTLISFKIDKIEQNEYAIINKLKLKLEFLKNLSNIITKDNNKIKLKTDNNNLIFEIGEKTISLPKDVFISEEINEWQLFEIESEFTDVITFINIVSELLIQQNETLLLSQFYKASQSNMMKKINIVIENDSSKEVLNSIASFLKILARNNNTRNLMILCEDYEFVKKFLNENGMSNIEISDSISKKYQGIVVGSGNYFNKLFQEAKNKNKNGYFFLDNFESIEGSMLMAIAFATQNETIIEHIKKQGNDNTHSKISALWNILKIFDDESITIKDKMPAIKPILKYLLKHLAGEKFTILKAA